MEDNFGLYDGLVAMKRNNVRDCDKVAYGTEMEAYLALETIREKGRTMKTTPVRNYLCPYCNKYHLTSKRYEPNKRSKHKKKKG